MERISKAGCKLLGRAAGTRAPEHGAYVGPLMTPISNYGCVPCQYLHKISVLDLYVIIHIVAMLIYMRPCFS